MILMYPLQAIKIIPSWNKAINLISYFISIFYLISFVLFLSIWIGNNMVYKLFIHVKNLCIAFMNFYIMYYTLNNIYEFVFKFINCLFAWRIFRNFKFNSIDMLLNDKVLILNLKTLL